VDVAERAGRPELPLDVRRGGSAGSSAVLVEAVLDALPSPTVLLDADGRILLANSAWTVATDFLEDHRLQVGVGDDYHAKVTDVSVTDRPPMGALPEYQRRPVRL